MRRYILHLLVVTISVVAGVEANLDCSDQQYPYRNMCVSLVGGPCSNPTSATVAELCMCYSNLPEDNHNSTTTNDDSPNYKFMAECTPGAYCTHVIKGGGRFPVCVCLPCLSETRDRKCAAAFGESCGDVDCVEGLKCSGSKNVGGECVCKTLHKYDSGLQRCIGLVGAFCNTRIDEKLSGAQCTAGAACLSRTTSQLYGNGECRCKLPHFRETANRTCEQAPVSQLESRESEEDDGYNSTSTIVGISVLLTLLVACCLFLICLQYHVSGR